MKKTIFALLLLAMAQISMALTPGWTGVKYITLVRQNYDGFYFMCKDDPTFYGTQSSAANYRALATAIITAKNNSLPVSLHVDPSPSNGATHKGLVIDGFVVSVSGVKFAP